MLAAYLRGLLKPSTDYGMRSFIFEDVVLEAMTADIVADRYTSSIAVDAAIAGILTDDSKRNAMRRIQRQTKRRGELQLMDIYGLEAGSKFKQTAEGRVSLLQLFQLMRDQGIIDPDGEQATETHV